MKKQDSVSVQGRDDQKHFHPVNTLAATEALKIEAFFNEKAWEVPTAKFPKPGLKAGGCCLIFCTENRVD